MQVNHSAIMRGATRVGQFATVSGLSLSANRSLAVTYQSDPVSGKPAVYYTVAIPGDATLSNGVGFADLVILAQNYNRNGRQWVTGDFNGSGATDFGDLVILAQPYNQTSLDLPAGVTADFASDWALAESLVPEPATVLTLSSIACMAMKRRRG